MATVTITPPRRRVVHRRSALDKAYDAVLADLPVEIRPAVRAYAEAKRAEYDARSALSTELTRHGLRWMPVDDLARSLAFA
jgi:hypothetical protein